MNKNLTNKAFTVLEFLIVLTIILILIAIILPNLQKARERSSDEKRVSDLKTISLGLEQFKQVCGSYPVTIDSLTECQTNTNITLGQFVPEIPEYNFNDSSQLNYIYYTAFSVSSTDSQCVAFHLGTKIKNETIGIFAVGDSNINSQSNINSPYVICPNSIDNTFDGNDPNTYDIFKQ